MGNQKQMQDGFCTFSFLIVGGVALSLNGTSSASFIYDSHLASSVPNRALTFTSTLILVLNPSLLVFNQRAKRSPLSISLLALFLLNVFSTLFCSDLFARFHLSSITSQMFSRFPCQKSHSIFFPSLLSCGSAVGDTLVGWQSNTSMFILCLCMPVCVLECWAMVGGKGGQLHLLSLPHHVPHYLQMPSLIQLHPFNPAQHKPTHIHKHIAT